MTIPQLQGNAVIGGRVVVSSHGGAHGPADTWAMGFVLGRTRRVAHSVPVVQGLSRTLVPHPARKFSA